MFIGYYKAVNKAKEFYSQKRENLDFPTQVEDTGERYLLSATHMANGITQEKNVLDRATELGIPCNVKVD